MKVTLLGPAGVGKSSLVARKAFDTFDEHQQHTIGAAFCIVNHSLHVWDTAGQERYANMVPAYVAGARAIIVCFCSIATYNKAKAMLHSMSSRIDPDTYIVMCRTKIDENPHEYIAVDIGDTTVRTSAKTGEGIGELFDLISQRDIDNIDDAFINLPASTTHDGAGSCCRVS